jgi:hypothetical protein
MYCLVVRPSKYVIILKIGILCANDYDILLDDPHL